MEHKIGARDDEWVRLRILYADPNTDAVTFSAEYGVTGERYDDAVRQLEALREAHASWMQEAMRLGNEKVILQQEVEELEEERNELENEITVLKQQLANVAVYSRAWSLETSETARLRGVLAEIQDKASGFAGYTGCFLQWGAYNYERAKERGIKLADIYNYVTEALKS